jgi:GcrA cell cycle regulator
MGWTEERVALLKRMWTEGHSASQIAKELGHVTRNAVIGKVHRLGLSGRATPSRPVKRPQRAPKPRPVVAVKEVAPVVDNVVALKPVTLAPAEMPALPQPKPPLRLANGALVTVTSLRDSMCKWPVGDPMEPGFHFCGHAAAVGSYCTEHAAMAYQPAAARKQKNDADRALLARLSRMAG